MKLGVHRTRRGRRVACLTAAALAATAGFAYASIPDGNGLIQACVLKNVGSVRLIDTAKSGLLGQCSALETRVSWNQKGQPGATGAPGQQGPPGADGTSGYQLVRASAVIAAGTEIVGTLGCPAGTRAVGGGWTTDDNNGQVTVIGSGPTSDGGAWTGGMNNTSNTSANLTLSVLCITVPATAAEALARTAAHAPTFSVADPVSAG